MILRAALVLTCATFAVVIKSAEAESGGPVRVSEEDRCRTLLRSDFTDLADAPTQITQTKWVNGKADMPGYCEVSGHVEPRVEFLLRLPARRWNGKVIELGCGGPCGTLEHIQKCADPLQRGYACVVSDGGHKADVTDPMKWARENPQKAIEYITRASHVTAMAAKRVVRQFYRRKAEKAYFMGCSAGGLQALWLAQKFPWEFDGILAGGPALSLSRIWLNWIWANRALTGADGKSILQQPDLEMLHQNVVARCDMNDGIKDGVIGDPRQCQFEPEELLCASENKGRCLNAQQVDAVAKIYDGPVTSTGKQIAAPIALRGSELTWSVFFGSDDTPNPTYVYLKDWYHYSTFPIDFGPTWKPESVDFDEDYKRLGSMEALEPLFAPDLRRFDAAGGKLLVYTGWNDSIEGVLNTVEYYELAETIAGGRAATQDFFRLFVVTGMNHCSGGQGAFAIDYLSALERWVERGEAPEKLIGAHVRTNDLVSADAKEQFERRLRFPLDPAYVEFTRPIFPYPSRTKYSGRGDPNNATNFERAEP